MGSGFVAVGRFASLISAQFYQSLLRERGIDSFIPNESVAGLSPYGLPMGSIEIMVPKSHEDEARGVPAEMGLLVSGKTRHLESAGENGPVGEDHAATAAPFDQDELPPIMDENRNGIYAHLALVFIVVLALGLAYVVMGIVSAL